jgi:glycosyltransferase involved in cell wall biosynthesis
MPVASNHDFPTASGQPAGEIAGAAPAFSVVIPCFNEEQGLRRTVEQLRAALADRRNYELIIVDDGSTDGSRRVLAELAGADPALVVVEHDRNRGYGAALKTGISHARAAWIVITDADGSYPLERIGHLVDLTRDCEMVVGARTADDAHQSFLRRIPKAFLRVYASWIADRNIPDINSGMRVFRRDLAEKYRKILPDGFSFTTTITLALLTNGYRVKYEPIGYKTRVGRSKIRPIRDTLQFTQLILRTGTYFAPLRAFSPFIAVLSLAFIASLIYDVVMGPNLTDKTVILLISALNTGFFALLADLIVRRSDH